MASKKKPNVSAKRSSNTSAKRSKRLRGCTNGRNPNTGKCYSKKQANAKMNKLSKRVQKAAALKVKAALQRNVSAKRSSKSSKKLSNYQAFMKKQVPIMKAAHPKDSHKEAFARAAKMWTSEKSASVSSPKIARTARGASSRSKRTAAGASSRSKRAAAGASSRSKRAAAGASSRSKRAVRGASSRSKRTI